MGCATASPRAVRCRRGAASAGSGRAAAGAGSAAAATTAPAGSAVRAAPAVRRTPPAAPSWLASGQRNAMPTVDAGSTRAGPHAVVQPQQQVGRRAIGAMDDERPAEPVGLRPDLGAVTLDPQLIVGAPGLEIGRASCRKGGMCRRVAVL